MGCGIKANCPQVGLAGVAGFKADCLTKDIGLWVECPPWGVFLRWFVGLFKSKSLKNLLNVFLSFHWFKIHLYNNV